MLRQIVLCFLCASTALGCGKGDDSAQGVDTAGGDTAAAVDTAPPSPMATGNIDTRDGRFTGSVSVVRAFSFFNGNTTLIYGAANPAATCESVAHALGAEGNYDPNDLFLPEHCNLVIQTNQAPPLAGYDLQSDSGATVRANCAYGSGEWSWMDGFVGVGWYYSGVYYSPLAWKGSFSISEVGSARDLEVEVDLREWEGRFPHDSVDTDEHKASGRVEGTITALDCPALEETPWF